ncbi:hypothetical protein R5H30_02875 [Sulfitobacter sp. D35]|uniref:hypothetical protein n=1 Tax=Sulfitobacter sp. D35 TaxID=3083252 RepID=UPI00296F5105|nr:hypothetical protein [Sulfitobacter sp. D35]MDW4496911.1 hypothetical protein [Sulfitobacter sp. D35]
MPRWLWFAPLAALTLFLAVWLFRLGWIAATITETDVIGGFAQRYLQDAGPGARVTDCVARPAEMRGLWLVVSCRHADGRRFDYPADRLGRWRRPEGRKAGEPET